MAVLTCRLEYEFKIEYELTVSTVMPRRRPHILITKDSTELETCKWIYFKAIFSHKNSIGLPSFDFRILSCTDVS